MRITKKLIILFFSILPLIIKAQDMSSDYKIYDVKKQTTIRLADIVADMANADVLFFGEEHNDSIAHYLEITLFKNLASVYKNKIGLTL